MRRILVLATLLALMTTACKLELNLAADLDADATGTVTLEVGLDDEAAGFFLSETDPFEDAPPGAETRIEDRGEMTYYLTTQSFTNEEELVTLMTGEEAPFETFDATFAEDLVTVAGTVGDDGGFFDEGDLDELTPDQLTESISAEVRITMPGRVLEHDADTIAGSTLTWEIDLLGSPITVNARSDPAGEPDEEEGGIPAWVIAFVAIAIVAGAGYIMYRRSRGGPVFQPEPPTT